jgi:O-antigen/teichoic acid export membrane protein
VGKFLGAASLGYYNRAYSLMTYPVTLFTSVITPALHPVFSQIQTDIDQIRENYLNVLKAISILSFPLMVFLAVNAKSVITIVWGGQWQQSIPVFQILGIAALFQPIVNTTGSIYLVRSKTNWLLKVGIVNTIVTIAGIVIGLQYGIKGVAIGYTIAFLLMLFPILYIVFNKLLEGSVWEFFRKISTALKLVLLIGISNAILLYFVKDIYISIIANTAITGTLFFISVWYLERSLFGKIKGYLYQAYTKIRK